MRDPLARFISGYAAIEKELRQKEAEGLAMEDPERGLETFGDIWRPWNIIKIGWTFRKLLWLLDMNMYQL